jgi:hypothetical protein
VDPNPAKMQVTVRVQIYQQYSGGGSLNTEYSFEIPETDFMGLCKILAQFDELAQKVKKEHG